MNTIHFTYGKLFPNEWYLEYCRPSKREIELKMRIILEGWTKGYSDTRNNKCFDCSYFHFFITTDPVTNNEVFYGIDDDGLTYQFEDESEILDIISELESDGYIQGHLIPVGTYSRYSCGKKYIDKNNPSHRDDYYRLLNSIRGVPTLFHLDVTQYPSCPIQWEYVNEYDVDDNRVIYKGPSRDIHDRIIVRPQKDDFVLTRLPRNQYEWVKFTHDYNRIDLPECTEDYSSEFEEREKEDRLNRSDYYKSLTGRQLISSPV